MEKDYGEPIRYDPQFTGPVHRRSCTDILWLIIFILFLGAWVYVGYYSISHGDVERLLAPMDSKGRRCGLDSEVANKKYLVFFDITRCLSPGAPVTGCPTPQVCVEKCPTQTIFFKQMTSSSWPTLKSSMVCQDDIDINSLSFSQAMTYIENERCANYVLESQPVLGRCFINVENAYEHLKDVIQMDEEELLRQFSRLIRFQELSSQIVEDLVQSRWYMVGAIFVVVLICFIYIMLLRWVVAPVVWISIGALIGLLGFLVYLCYKNYAYYRANPVTLIQTTNLKGYAESIFTKHQTWLALLIILAVILVILVLIVIFLRSRIVIAIALIKEGSKAVNDIKSTVVFPILPWILQCGAVAAGVIIFMYLLSIGDSSFKVVNMANDTACQCSDPTIKDYSPCDPIQFPLTCHDQGTGRQCNLASCHFVGVDNPHYVGYLHLVNLIGFFWLMFFIQGVSDMMLASTFSTWYWTFNKKNLPFFTLTSGIYRTIRYHLGTVALGALIITIVRVIRVILEYIDHKLKKFDNAFTRCVLCCCKCFFYCLENFLKFINKNAYIMCAVHGGSFCKSARDAFSLLMRNIVRVVVLDKVTDFLFFLSKVLISLGVAVSVYYVQQWSYIYELTRGERLHHHYVPAVILGVATYLITTIFFNVYSMSVDTLFLCFLEDVERNDGSADKPYFMSKNLLKILGKKNKIA